MHCLIGGRAEAVPISVSDRLGELSERMPAYPEAVRAALWFVASATIAVLTVLVGADVGDWHRHRWVAFVCAPLLMFTVYLQLVRFKRDDGPVTAIGGDPKRVRRLAERDALRQVLRLRRII